MQIGHCGFPGRPKYGEFAVEFDDSLLKATYSCPSNSHSPTKRLEGEATRICSNGTWNGSIPRCGDECICKLFLSNLMILYSGERVDPKYYSSNDGNLTDGKRNSCEIIQERPSVTLNFNERVFIWRVDMFIKIPNNSKQLQSKKFLVNRN
jgi:hypothetical protein